MMGLSKEEWKEAEKYGIPPQKEEVELWESEELVPDSELMIFFDVKLCLSLLHMQRVREGVVHLVYPSTISHIPVRCIERVENYHTGKVVWERDPGPPTTEDGPRFYFQTQLPPHQRSGRYPDGESRQGAAPAAKVNSVLDEDWEVAYTNSPTWCETWEQATDITRGWPRGYQIHRKKLYREGKLCVPEENVLELVRAYHFLNGHPGIERLVKGLYARYNFPEPVPDCNVRESAIAVKRGCVICQVSEPPNWATKGKYESTPIPEAPFQSVSVDIFSMPEVSWRENTFDCVVICVDRHSGWMIAQPTTALGLTSEKCAHLLLEGGWDQFGIPSTVTSDQGPQFASAWFQTMSARLGLHETFSQAYHPQANGRAEVAGKQFKDLLRKLHAEDEINWVEAIPRALRLIHDRVGEAGLSPYQILMGRERPLAGLPYTSNRECPEAHEYFDHIQEIDKQVAKRLEATHAAAQQRHNSKIRVRPPFQIGDTVWVKKPPQLGGAKLQTYWVGPTTIISRAGDSSFEILTPDGYQQGVHASQLKHFYDDVLEGGVPLHFYRPHYREGPPPDPRVLCILSHRIADNGTPSFLVRWVGALAEQDSWIELQEFIRLQDTQWVTYCQEQGIASIPVGAMAQVPTVHPSL
jgi:hypothetical protein